MERYSLAVVTAPSCEPVSLAEAKQHLRIDADITDQDTLVSALIAAAREWVENYCRRSLVQRTLALRMDCFPGQILLPRGPVISIDSITYQSGGASATLAASDYQADLYSTPARVVPPFGGVFPLTDEGTLNAVTITYTAGYAPLGSPTDEAAYQLAIPKSVKAAIKLLIGHWFENREAVVLANMQVLQLPMAVRALLAPYEIRDMGLE